MQLGQLEVEIRVRFLDQKMSLYINSRVQLYTRVHLQHYSQ